MEIRNDIRSTFDYYEAAMNAASISIVKTEDLERFYKNMKFSPRQKDLINRSLAELASASPSKGEYSVILHSDREFRALATDVDRDTAIIKGASRGTGYVLSELTEEVDTFNHLFPKEKIPLPYEWEKQEYETAMLDPTRAFAKIGEQFKSGSRIQQEFYKDHSVWFERIIAAARESERNITIEQLAVAKKEINEQRSGKKSKSDYERD